MILIPIPILPNPVVFKFVLKLAEAIMKFIF